MYQTLTAFHSGIRWLVLVALLLALYRALRGYLTKSTFTRTDNAIRHWTATSAHIQLLVGVLLYFQSPVAEYFRKHTHEAMNVRDTTFFGIVHPLLMLAAIVVLTIGSALAKRRTSDQDKFRTMLIWFTAALFIILIAIPWPFSPLSSRPYIR